MNVDLGSLHIHRRDTNSFGDHCSSKNRSTKAGSSQQEWQMWMEHQRQHDHHDSLAEQMKWLGEAGFAIVDCPWRYLLWTVMHAIK